VWTGKNPNCRKGRDAGRLGASLAGEGGAVRRRCPPERGHAAAGERAVTGLDRGRVVETPRDSAGAAPDRAPGRDVATRARAYAWTLLGAATATGVALLVSGARLPSFGPVLLLGLVIALCLNQLAFFPNEWSATAEAAVLVAAVVGFAGAPGSDPAAGAALLGPYAVAMTCGPLDTVHWRQRAFWRMAYNSGNRMLAAVLAAVAFAEVRVALGSSALAFAAAALAASLAIALVDLVVFVGFERVRGGTSLRSAVRDDLVIDCLTVPLGMIGALAGWIATRAGWWVAPFVLVPAAFAPELVLVRCRRLLARPLVAARIRRSAPTLVVAACVLAIAALVAPVPDPVPFITLVVVAVLAGVELRADARAPVAPLVAVIVAASLVLGAGAGDARLSAAVAVAVVATATATVSARSPAGARWWSPLLAAAAAVVATRVFDARPGRAGALAAALAFEVLVLARWSRLVWSAPLVCAAIALACVGDAAGTSGVAWFGAGVAAVAVCASLWGAPPWTSGVLASWAARRAARWSRVALVSTCVVALGAATAVSVTSAGRPVLVPLAAAAAAAVLGMGAVASRQWRFAPVRRRVDALLAVTAACGVVIGYPSAAFDGNAWSVAVVAVSLAVGLVTAWPAARLLAAAHPDVRAVDTRGARSR
jgi:hypothetical protein